MGRAEHSLEKTIATVVEAIEHVREVEVAIAADAVSMRCWQNFAPLLAGEYQTWTSFLNAEVLTFAIEDLCVSRARNPCCVREALQDSPCAGVIGDAVFDVDDVEQDMSSTRAA